MTGTPVAGIRKKRITRQRILRIKDTHPEVVVPEYAFLFVICTVHPFFRVTIPE
jgi:hypothetical protein